MTVVTNVERLPDGSPWEFGQVTIGLVGAGFDSAGGQVVGVARDLTQGGEGTPGLASFDLVPNADGEFYVWTGPDKRQWQFGPVPASGGPYPLQALNPTNNITVAVGQTAATVGGLTAAIAAEQTRANGAYVSGIATQSFGDDGAKARDNIDAVGNPEHGSTVGASTYDAGTGLVTVALTTQWSVDGDGAVFFTEDYALPVGNTPAVLSIGSDGLPYVTEIAS